MVTSSWSVCMPAQTSLIKPTIPHHSPKRGGRMFKFNTRSTLAGVRSKAVQRFRAHALKTPPQSSQPVRGGRARMLGPQRGPRRPGLRTLRSRASQAPAPEPRGPPAPLPWRPAPPEATRDPASPKATSSSWFSH